MLGVPPSGRTHVVYDGPCLPSFLAATPTTHPAGPEQRLGRMDSRSHAMSKSGLRRCDPRRQRYWRRELARSVVVC